MTSTAQEMHALLIDVKKFRYARPLFNSGREAVRKGFRESVLKIIVIILQEECNLLK